MNDPTPFEERLKEAEITPPIEWELPPIVWVTNVKEDGTPNQKPFKLTIFNTWEDLK